MSARLRVENDDGVLVVTFDRPDRLNAIDGPMQDELREAFTRAAWASDVGCVVLTGAGRAFCAGGDTQVIARREEAAAESGPPNLEKRVDRLRYSVGVSKLLHDMPKPAIAMVNGPCAGMGLALAGACDLRFAGASALFTSAFVKIGLSGDLGGMWFWSQILGTAGARRLYMLSERIDAAKALSMGMVHEVWPDDELRARTMAIARQLADGPRPALRYVKEVLNAAEDGAYEQVLEHEALAHALSGAAKAEAARARRGGA